MTDDPFDELGRELRDRVGAELRAEAEAAERDADLLRRRQRDLADLLREWADHGDHVELVVAGRRLGGAVRSVAGDLVTLVHGDATVTEVRLSAAVVVTRVPADAPPPRSGPRSFVARLRERERDRRPTTLTLSDASEVAGTIVVAQDHVVVSGSGAPTTAVALAAVVAAADPVR